MTGGLYIFLVLMTIIYMVIMCRSFSSSDLTFKSLLMMAGLSFVYEIAVMIFGWNHIILTITQEF